MPTDRLGSGNTPKIKYEKTRENISRCPTSPPSHILCGTCRPAASYPVSELCARFCRASRSSWAGSGWAPAGKTLRCLTSWMLDHWCCPPSETLRRWAVALVDWFSRLQGGWTLYISWETAVSHYRNDWRTSATQSQGAKQGARYRM